MIGDLLGATSMSTLFYRNPVLINLGQHASLGFKPTDGYGFARETNAVPVNLIEFQAVGRDYPIAFVGGAEPYPAAIVGLKEDNLFVGADGAWKAGAYVPAYVRRYPFIFADDKDRDLLSLCVDEPSLVAEGGAPIFEGEGPSPFTSRALDFCKQYHAAALPTQVFASAVVEQDLLAERQVNVTLKDGRSYVLNGVKMIDEDKVAKLSGEVLADWNAKGWLKGLFAIIQSGANWGDLGDMLAAGSAPAADAKGAKSKG